MSTRWDVEQYERYKTYRDRPALDLLLQVPGDLDSREIWDLGCGAGEHAALLARRHPQARVHGLDASADMLEAARARSSDVEWVEASIADFAPASPPDLIFTNAALQWLPDHAALVPRLVSLLQPGGVFACQIPVSSEEPWYRAVREIAREGLGDSRFNAIQAVYPTGEPSQYYRWLAPLAEVDLWTTTYLHVLDGPHPVVEWMRGTALRPYIQAFATADEREAFLDLCRVRMADYFPAEADGSTLFPFPRLFIIARRRG